MDLQVVLPDEAPDMDPGRPAALARAAEELGYETVFLPDHVLPPGPYGEVFGGVYEPLITLAHIAAVTERIRLGTSVLIVPLRDPFVLAKQVATLDRLSRHRLTLGAGVGWNTPEFAELGADFAARGKRTDETLELLDTLFTTGRGPDGGHFEPRPEGRIPVLAGGNSTAALRRAARLGDVWQSAGLSPADFENRVVRLNELAGGREIRASARMEWTGGRDDLDRAVADAHAYAGAGASAVAVHFGAESGYAERMAEFAERMTSSPPGL
ncbi:TIGR03619 family F420-dependent LLM class oxidoreductase [Amycolatopsis sp. NPDC058986]|uniref:TIGR03619 family F420-dependent LLM class oxidoreductase n=1 Tax=unclassified Amycolatopsis TaxID=2618356 RepID=UPI003671952D